MSIDYRAMAEQAVGTDPATGIERVRCIVAWMYRTFALLPTDYVNDVHQRLSMYKKLASADDEDELIGRQEELVDRYGKLPEAAKALIETHRLRLAAEKLGVKKIDASNDVIIIQFVHNPPFDTAKLIALMQRSKTMRLAGPERLRIEERTPNFDARLQRLREVFKAIA